MIKSRSLILLSSFLVAGALCVSTITMARFPQSVQLNSVDPSYTLTIDDYGDIQNGTLTTKGNTILFSSSGVSDSGGNIAISKDGYFYNTTKLSGISHIEVTLVSGDINIYYGTTSTTFTNYIHGTEYNLASIYPNYFKIEALSATVIESITVKYACVDYQASSEATKLALYVNGVKCDSPFVDNSTQELTQYKVILDVYAGDVLTFTKNSSGIYPIASGDGNNVYHIDTPNSLIVKNSKHNAHLYLKDLASYYDVWLGEGSDVAASSMQDGTILHAWDWSVTNIMNQLDDIAAAGYRSIQLSPMQVRKYVYSTDSWRDRWMFQYIPFSFSVAQYNDESIIGKKADLIALCEAAKAKGVEIIMDVVLNHLCGQNTSSLLGDVSYYEPTIYNNTNQYLHNYKGNHSKIDDTQEGIVRGSMGDYPDLNTGDQYVQGRALSLLKEYLDCGVTGFRFDAAKHIETPRDGYYASNFWPYVVNGAKRYAFNKGYDAPYFYGEILGAGNNRDLGWYTPYMSITEGSNDYNIRDAITNPNENFDKLNGNYYAGQSPSKYVLWAESHDHYQSGGTSWINEECINKVYAIQASRSEATALYLARPNENSKMGEVGSTGFKNSVVAAVNKLHSLYAGFSEYIDKNNGSFVNVRGSGADAGALIVNVNNGNSSYWVALPQMAAGTYKDLITGHEFEVHDGGATLSFTDGVCVLVPAVSTSYYLVGNKTYTGTDAEWTTESGRIMSKTGQNLAELSDVEISSGAKVKIVKTYDNGAASDWFGGLGESYDFCHNDGEENIVFTEGGTYNFFLSRNDSKIYIYQHESGGGDPEPEPEPEPQEVTYTITNLPNWITDDGCVVFAWVWGDGEPGAWVSCVYGDYDGNSKPRQVSFTVDQQMNGCLLARCVAGTTTPNWSQKGDTAGRVYNKTNDVTFTNGNYSYASPDWVGYSPS